MPLRWAMVLSSTEGCFHEQQRTGDAAYQNRTHPPTGLSRLEGDRLGMGKPPINT